MSAVTGRRGEYQVIARLLLEGMAVFLPVVDEGIDCVVRGPHGHYREVQIKTRTSRNLRGKLHHAFRVRAFRPRNRFFIVLHYADREDYWVIPSRVFAMLAKEVQGRRGRRYFRLVLSEALKAKLAPYRNAFTVLRGAKARA